MYSPFKMQFYLFVLGYVQNVLFLSMAECFFVEPNEPFHIGTLEENKLNLTLDFHRWGR